jgi:adenylate kinase
MIIIMLGAQGSGKGTVGTKLAEALLVPHISTGDIFRENIKAGTELGIEANKYILEGKLVPDELTNRIVADRFSKEDTQGGAILDGYPRTKEQCEELDRILENQGKHVDLAINLDVPYEELIARITTRRVCSKCKEGYNIEFNPPKVDGVCDKCGGEVVQRDDDKPDAVKERLNIYYSNAEVVTSYYAAQGKLRNEVAGDNVGRTSNDVVADLVKDLK